MRDVRRLLQLRRRFRVLVALIVFGDVASGLRLALGVPARGHARVLAAWAMLLIVTFAGLYLARTTLREIRTLSRPTA